MATATISSKFQILIPRELREKLHVRPRQRLQIIVKGGIVTLVPEVPLRLLKGALSCPTASQALGESSAGR
jgi:AbrB family looped-hinge helix DNA binding protein